MRPGYSANTLLAGARQWRKDGQGGVYSAKWTPALWSEWESYISSLGRETVRHPVNLCAWHALLFSLKWINARHAVTDVTALATRDNSVTTCTISYASRRLRIYAGRLEKSWRASVVNRSRGGGASTRDLELFKTVLHPSLVSRKGVTLARAFDFR